MDWSVKCPHCGKEVDSQDSYADSRAMLRSHIENSHPDDGPINMKFNLRRPE